MSKILGTISLLVCLCFLSAGQNDRIDLNHLDTEKLSSLVVKRINVARSDKGYTSLSKHSALQKAADDHVKYIAQKGQLLHRQTNAKKAKARDRVEFYGGEMRGIGENLAYIKLYIPAIYKGPNGRLDTLNIKSYGQAAEYLVHSWMNSSAHRANIFYKDYEYTGLSVSFIPSTNTLYAVQVFAFGEE